MGKQKHPNLCVCVHTHTSGQTRAGTPERLLTDDFCMLYHYSILKIYLSRAFGFFRIRPKALLFLKKSLVNLNNPYN